MVKELLTEMEEFSPVGSNILNRTGVIRHTESIAVQSGTKHKLTQPVRILKVSVFSRL